MSDQNESQKVSREFLSMVSRLGDNETLEVIIVISEAESSDNIRLNINQSGATLSSDIGSSRYITAVGTKASLGKLLEFAWVLKMMWNQPVHLIN